MILVARPIHRANEERHIRHERRYSTAVRSSIGCPQKGERGFTADSFRPTLVRFLPRGIEKKLGLAARLASCMRDRRNPERIVHPLEEMLRLRMLAIAAGYEDADDCDLLRYDPIFKMAAATRWRAAILCVRSPRCRGWRMRRRRSRSPD